MNRINSKDSPNVSISSSNGTSKISSTNLSSSLMNNGGQLIYRRSPIPQTQQTSTGYQHGLQPGSFDTLGSPSTVSYNSEEVSDNINSFEEDHIAGLHLKLEQLQRQVELLTQSQTTQEERYKRSRQENDALLNKIHSLEDQLRELDLNAEARSIEDEKRFREAMAKQMKTHSQECEQHLHANFVLQQDLFKLKNDLMKSEATIKTIRSEKESIEFELQDKNCEISKLDEELHKMKLLVKNLRDEEKVKENLISILNEELEDSHNRSQREHGNQLKVFEQSSAVVSTSSFINSPHQRSSSSRRSSITSGFGEDFLPPAQVLSVGTKAMKDIDGLEMSLSRLREENQKLREINEDLQAQLLNFQVEEGRSLVEEGSKSFSLADEMGDIDVHRLMKALKEKQEEIARHKSYIENILEKIIETKPEILEMKSNSSKKEARPVEPAAE